MSGPVVVKVGGSLLDWDQLPERLSGYLRTRAGESLVLLCGGGPLADAVRAFDRIYALGEKRAHELALRSLDVTAYVLASLVPRSRVVEQIDSLASEWEAGRLPVLAPRRFLTEVDRRSPIPLPEHWDVTSDSIAARVALNLDARELVLLKSARIPNTIDIDEASRLGLVDRAFPGASQGLGMISFLNLRDAEPAVTIAASARPRAITPALTARIAGRENPTGLRAMTRGRVCALASTNARGRQMARLELVPLDRPEVRPRPISPRLRSQLVYFMTAPGTPGVPPLADHEYWFAESEVAQWVDEGVFYLVSPLDTANMTEVELTEEQESLLNWLKTERIQYVRLVES